MFLKIINLRKVEIIVLYLFTIFINCQHLVILASPSFLPLYVCIDVSREREKNILSTERVGIGMHSLLAWRDYFLRQNKSTRMWGCSVLSTGTSHVPLTKLEELNSFPVSSLTLTAHGRPHWPYMCSVTCANLMRTWVWFWQQALWLRGKRFSSSHT